MMQMAFKLELIPFSQRQNDNEHVQNSAYFWSFVDIVIPTYSVVCIVLYCFCQYVFIESKIL